MKSAKLLTLIGVIVISFGFVGLALESARAYTPVIEYQETGKALNPRAFQSVHGQGNPLGIRQDEWIKTINGDPWSSGFFVSVETADTVQVVDVIRVDPNFTVTLDEAWNPNELRLISFAIEPPGSTMVITGVGQLTVIGGLDHPDVITVTKYFFIEPCTWQMTTLIETLEGPPVPEPPRPVTFQKLPPILRIDSQYDPEVSAGEPVTFTLNYGNDGGYENDVMIRNDFPAGAPYENAVPPPDRIGPGNQWAEWDVGDLPGGSDSNITVTIAISTSLPPSTTLDVVARIFDHTNTEEDGVLIPFHIRLPDEPSYDLGDAPDSTNHPGLPMTAYPVIGVPANYPTVFDPATGSPQGPLHLQPTVGAYLGPQVSLEVEADLPPDADGFTNLEPPGDLPNLDGADDGVGSPLGFPHCVASAFTFTVTVPPGAPDIPWFVNVWMDWNRDGDWEDLFTCSIDGDAPEWAVQNMGLPSLGSGTWGFQTPSYLPYHEVPEEPLWMRITLSEQAAAQPEDGRGPPSGFDYGETEDYYLPGQGPPAGNWEKWINGVPWTDGITFTVETSDTVEVIDVIRIDPVDVFLLRELWNPEELMLIDYTIEPLGPTIVITAPNQLSIEWLPDHANVITVTKWFHVEPSIWEVTNLLEFLEPPIVPEPSRGVSFQKRPPILWIDSQYDSEVSAGDVATFTLNYGNLGGYENNVTIVNEFLPEALFVSAFPPPDSQAPDGSLATWNVGDIPGGDGGEITVTVAIAASLIPSTTIDITDYILNHLGMVMEATTIRFHIEEPPLEDTDIYIKDNPLDDGAVPTNEPWWISPDIWVRTDGNCANTAHQNPLAGAANTICVRVRNRSAVHGQNIKVDVYFGSAALGFHWPGGWSPVGSVSIPSLAPGSTTVATMVWNTPNITGHFCLLVRADAFNDPIGSGIDTMAPAEYVQNNNNISMLNLNIIAFPEFTDCSYFTSTVDNDVLLLDVVNTTNVTSTVDVIFAGPGFPLDAGDFIVEPGGLWGRWSTLENFDPSGLTLIPIDFPARIGGVQMAPFESAQVTVSITTEIGIEFTIEVRENINDDLVGGIHYLRDLPDCIFLPLVERFEEPPANQAGPGLFFSSDFRVLVNQGTSFRFR